MGVVAEIGRLATCAWAPSGSHVVSGTYAGAVDTSFEASSALELLALDVTNERLVPGTSLSLPEKFTSIAWGPVFRAHPAGLIAGGLNDGVVRIWDAAALLRQSSDSAAADPKRGDVVGQSFPAKHSGPVQAVAFNNFVGSMLATGGSDGQVLIWDLASGQPSVNAPGASDRNAKDDIVAIAWNKKVQHILGTGAASGAIAVWDLKNRKQVISIRNPRGRLRASSVVWHPDTATQVLVGCDEDDGTGAQIWDLRNATAPLLSLAHHSPRGVLSAAWCPQDSDLIITTSRDGRTVVVSASSGSVLLELPKSTSWNFGVDWSPRSAGVFLSCSFDGRVSVSSILTANAAASVSAETANALAESFGPDAGDFQSGMALQSPRSQVAERESVSLAYAPKWLRRPCCVSIGFGGRMASVDGKHGTSVSVASLMEQNSSVVEVSVEADKALGTATADDPGALSDFCTNFAKDAPNGAERMAWEVLALQFQTDSRRKMLRYLGYSASPAVPGDMTDQVFGMEKSPVLCHPVRPQTSGTNGVGSVETVAAGNSLDQPADLNGTAIPDVGQLALDGPAPWDMGGEPDSGDSILDDVPSPVREESLPTLKGGANGVVEHMASKKGEFMGLTGAALDVFVKRSVIAGDFEVAVDASLYGKRYSDALIIANAGGSTLWERTQAEFLATSSAADGAKVVGAIAGPPSKMDAFIQNAVTSGKDSWKEALAVIITYIGSSKFAEAASTLGQSLLASGSRNSALICFLAAGNTHQIASLWQQSRPKYGNAAAALQSRMDALSSLVVKLRLVGAAKALCSGEANIGAIRAWDRISATVLCEYAGVLLSHGDISGASEYLASLDPSTPSVRGEAGDLQAKVSALLSNQSVLGGTAGATIAAAQQEPKYYAGPDAVQNPGYGYGQTQDMYGTGSGQLPFRSQDDAVDRASPGHLWNGSSPEATAPAAMLAAPVTPGPPAPPRPSSVFGSRAGGAVQNGGYTKTVYPSQAGQPSLQSGMHNEMAQANQSNYSVMTPAAPPAPPPPQMAAMPAPPPPPPTSGAYSQTGVPGGLPGHDVASTYITNAAPPPVPVMAGQMPVAPVEGFGAPSQMQAFSSGVTDPSFPGVGLPPPPPPPPDSSETPMPRSYHARATPGAGLALPPSSEVAALKPRHKPVSSSGTPGGGPKRSPSLSSSLSGMSSEAVMLDKVDVSSVPPNQQVIVKSIRGAFQYAQGLNGTAMYKKKMDDVSKKLGRLLGCLNARELDSAIVAKLVMLANGISKGDYDTARAVTNALGKEADWETNRHWLQAMHRLIDAVLLGR